MFFNMLVVLFHSSKRRKTDVCLPKTEGIEEKKITALTVGKALWLLQRFSPGEK